MSKHFKKICAVHDLSSYGRCALTVVIPTLSRFGHQVVPIPTALLSTHTGGFDNIFFMDLTDQITAISNHLKSINVKFDALYSGFLGSAHQIETVARLISDFVTEDTVFLLDPVMGDDGRLYSTYTTEMAEGIKKLASQAYILTPNLTEACILTDKCYPDLSMMSVKEAEHYSLDVLRTLEERYPNAHITVTGISCKNKTITVCKEHGREINIIENDLFPISFPGTGDLYASLLLSKVLSGCDIYSSAKYACDMTTHAVSISQTTDEPIRNGILLEKFLSETNF